MSQSIWSPSQCVGTIPIIRGPTTQPWKTVDNHPCLLNAFNCAVHHLASHLLFLLTLIQPETRFFILILQKKKNNEDNMMLKPLLVAIPDAEGMDWQP